MIADGPCAVSVKSAGDGSVRVLDAPPVVVFSLPLLVELAMFHLDGPRWWTVDADGCLDVAGQATYQPLRFTSDGLGLICRRIDEAVGRDCSCSCESLCARDAL